MLFTTIFDIIRLQPTFVYGESIMKKFARTIIVSVTALVLCFTLSACMTKYVSKYNAMLMISSNTSDNASLSFDSFSGTYVFRFRNNGNDEVYITYEATLVEGNIKVYYDFNDKKLDLFGIESDCYAKGKTETFTGNKTIYVIIESDGKCNSGSFSFALEKAEK